MVFDHCYMGNIIMRNKALHLMYPSSALVVNCNKNFNHEKEIKHKKLYLFKSLNIHFFINK